MQRIVRSNVCSNCILVNIDRFISSIWIGDPDWLLGLIGYLLKLLFNTASQYFPTSRLFAVMHCSSFFIDLCNDHAAHLQHPKGKQFTLFIICLREGSWYISVAATRAAARLRIVLDSDTIFLVIALATGSSHWKINMRGMQENSELRRHTN